MKDSQFVITTMISLVIACVTAQTSREGEWKSLENPYNRDLAFNIWGWEFGNNQWNQWITRKYELFNRCSLSGIFFKFLKSYIIGRGNHLMNPVTKDKAVNDLRMNADSKYKNLEQILGNNEIADI